MTAKKINQILQEVFVKINPSANEIEEIKSHIKNFSDRVKNAVEKSKVRAEIFIGGSFAKKTLIKKGKYDIDFFLRFDKKYNEQEMSALSKKIISLMNLKDYLIIHGSRDYFKINLKENLFVEVIPVKNISTPKQAENITDLSVNHVRYINKKIRDKKILDEIKLAKAFCHANNCYGAESYINGFSGYAIELLIYHYKSFMNFLKAISKVSLDKKEVVDIEKKYRDRQTALMDINSSKLDSPIILIDPTYKQRNALAALSEETFKKFQKSAKSFLKSPSLKFFEHEKVDWNKIKKEVAKYKSNFVLIESETSKQEGDVAGSKLLKFYKHLSEEISVFFDICKKGFEYNDKKDAKFFFAVKPKKEVLFKGPNIEDKKNKKEFEKVHKNHFIKNARVFAKEKIKYTLKEFLKKWVEKNRKKVKEMYIENLKIID